MRTPKRDVSDENDMAEKDNYSEFIARKEDLHELNQLLDQEFARPEKERNYDRIERFYVSMQTLRALIKSNRTAIQFSRFVRIACKKSLTYIQ